jgi:EmrB/QacA subfamily drug resistance transporter
MSTAAPAPAAGSSGSRATFDRALIGVASVVIVGSIMSILDTTIVNVAINTLAKDFHSSLSTIQWVSTGYMLALATVIPLTGWAAHRFGTKRLYIMSISLFMLGSALCGAAWSAESLIVFRVLQGLGGGMIMPAGMTILAQSAGPQRVGRVMSVVGVPMLLGPIIGPVLGGWLVDDVSWRWIFYVNIPIGIVALTLAQRLLPKDEPKPGERLDWLGVLFLSPGLALLVYGLAESASHGGFGETGVWGPMVAGIALIAAFVRHALRSDHPLIDLQLFRHRTMAAASATTFLFISAFFGAMFLMPLYFQIVRGESALQAGLLLIPQGVGAAVMMPIAGRLTDRSGAGRVVIAGLLVIIVGFFSFTQVTATTSYWLIGGSLFLLGLGMGATMMPAMSAAFQTMTHDAVPRATAALNILQRVGGSIGTALLSVVLSDQLVDRFPKAAGGNALGVVQNVPPAVHDKVAPQIASAFAHTFWWALALVALALVPALLLPRRRPADPDEPAPDGLDGETVALAEAEFAGV